MPKKAEPEETEVEGEENTIDTENVDYGKSCSIVWVFYLKKILEYCQPKQLVQNTTVCKKWKASVDTFDSVFSTFVQSSFTSSFLPPMPEFASQRETIFHLYNGSTEMTKRESNDQAVYLTLSRKQTQQFRIWKEEVVDSVEDFVPKAFLPWDTVDEAVDPDSTKINFQFFGQYCLITIRNEVASRIGCSNCQLKFWNDMLAEEEPEDDLEEEEDYYDSEEEGEEQYLEFVIDGKDFDIYNRWKNENITNRMSESSCLPKGTYGGSVIYTWSKKSGLKYTAYDS